MKIYNIRTAAVALLAALCCTSCNDKWDEHYDGSSANAASGSLWDAISGNSDLTNFTSVAKACGYDVMLSGSQTYTVFAPTNASLDKETADGLVATYTAQKNSGVKDDENTVIKQFVQNHISLYKHSVSSETDDSLTMMNGKYQTLTSNSIGGETFISKDALYNNGLLYTIGGQLTYNPNVFEYLNLDGELDSVYNFISSYGEYEFQADQSVPGEIIDGQTHYLDSVTEYKNAILDELGYINNEDSTYWLLAPTNSEWAKLVEEYTPYFTYAPSVDGADSLQYLNARLAIIYGSFFNRSTNPDAAFQDSAVATTAERWSDLSDDDNDYCKYFRPFDAGGIFDGTEDITLSNGHVRKASDYRITKYQTFFQEHKVEAESFSAQDTLLNAVDPVTTRTVSSSNPFYNKVSNNYFVEIVPKTTSVNPIVSYEIPSLLSNVGYDIYVVFAPALAYDTLATAEQRLPNRFVVYYEYIRANGTQMTEQVRRNFTTTPDVVDTVQISSNYSFPTASYGLSEAQTKIRIQSSVSNSQTSTYSRTLRIDCIIFKPHNDESAETKIYRLQ